MVGFAKAGEVANLLPSSALVPDAVSCEGQRMAGSAAIRRLVSVTWPRLTFLAGSGISASSGLPTGWSFNDAIIECLSAHEPTRRSLRRLVASGRRGARLPPLRFERIVQTLRDTVDPQLDILRCFESRSTPGFLHHFLADALARGSVVMTTNFDALVEEAYLGDAARPPLTQVIYETCPLRFRGHRTTSFRTLALRGRTPSLLKLHGSLADLDALAASPRASVRRVDSLNATLDTIGNRQSFWGLEYWKHRAVRSSLSGRVLVVLGYSGTDDFDVIPSLARAMAQCRGLIFIRHAKTGILRYRSLGADPPSFPIPHALAEAASRHSVPTFVVTGPADLAVRHLFPASRGLPAPPPASPFTASSLMSIPLYRSISTPERRRIAARLFELSGELTLAAREYRGAIRAARRSRPRDLASIAYSYNRLGYIAWTRGNNTSARKYFRASLALHRRIGSGRGIAAVLNNLGYESMSRGRLDKALGYYREAYRLHRQQHDQISMAKNLTNMGIVERKRGRLGLARRYFDRAFALSSRARDLEGIARDLGNIGNVLLGQERYADAVRVYARSLKLSEQIGKREFSATQLGNLGIAYRRLGRLRDAEHALAKALAMNRSLRRREGIEENLSTLGLVLTARGRFREATAKFGAARRIALAIGDREGLAEIDQDHAACLERAGKLADARRLLLRSKAQFEHLGNRRKARELTRRLAKIR